MSMPFKLINFLISDWQDEIKVLEEYCQSKAHKNLFELVLNRLDEKSRTLNRALQTVFAEIEILARKYDGNNSPEIDVLIHHFRDLGVGMGQFRLGVNFAITHEPMYFHFCHNHFVLEATEAFQCLIRIYALIRVLEKIKEQKRPVKDVLYYSGLKFKVKQRIGIPRGGLRLDNKTIEQHIDEALEIWESLDEYRNSIIGRIGDILDCSKQAYQGFGPYWWAVKSILFSPDVPGVKENRLFVQWYSVSNLYGKNDPYLDEIGTLAAALHFAEYFDIQRTEQDGECPYFPLGHDGYLYLLKDLEYEMLYYFAYIDKIKKLGE